MDSGTKVYRAYISGSSPELNWIDEGVVSEVLVGGVPLVRMASGVLVPLNNGCWRSSSTDARRDVHKALVRHIGTLQAKADKMADEILHEDLTAQEVDSGVA